MYCPEKRRASHPDPSTEKAMKISELAYYGAYIAVCIIGLIVVVLDMTVWRP